MKQGEKGGLAVSAAKLTALRDNIFEPAHRAITDWQDFPWHRDRRLQVQADKVQSSQALAIDVFGAIKTACEESRNTVLDAIARMAGLPAGGPWEVELEWSDPNNLLRERRRTQVDALAVGQHAIMVIECKFTETGGSCSQTNRINTGPAAGQRQCNGRYELQTHPVSGAVAHCALSAKGIRYWDVIPRIFDLDPVGAYAPCPFKGEAFQWMRNIVLAEELGRDQAKAARCIIAYAEGGGFPTEEKIMNLDWLPAFIGGARAPFAISFQQIAGIAREADGDSRWADLAAWIARKVALVRRNPPVLQDC
jgi:hypothetical protein